MSVKSQNEYQISALNPENVSLLSVNVMDKHDIDSIQLNVSCFSLQIISATREYFQWQMPKETLKPIQENVNPSIHHLLVFLNHIHYTYLQLFFFSR